MFRLRIHRRVLLRVVGVGGIALVLAACSAPASAVAEPAPGPAGWLFDPGSVVEIDLGLSQGEVDALEAEPDEYQSGSFVLKVGGEVQGPPLGDVGIRLKGSIGSFRPLTEKAAFKIKFDEYVDEQKFFGLEKLTLNNMVQDASMLHETLAYELFRSVDVAAPRTGYALVRLNGEDFGLHLNVETFDSISLPRWFGSTRHLFEADTAGLDVTSGNATAFEVDEGSKKKLEDLEALIAAANDEGGDWSDGMAAVADLGQMTRVWAVERYIGHWDGYAGAAGSPFRPNNYYLHSGDAGVEAGRFSMLPWGTDQTWDADLEFDEPAGGILFNRCLEDASCNALYVSALEDVRAAVPGLHLDRQAADLAALLAPCQELEAPPRREHSASGIEEEVEATRDFIADRPDELAAWLGLPLEGPATEGPSAESSPAEGPCSPPPPEQPEQEAGSSDPEVAAGGVQGWQGSPALRIGRSRALGAFVSTKISVPSAGHATQRVTAKLGGRRRTACKGQAQSDRAELLTVRCRLSPPVRHRLRAHWLKLRVAIRFEPEGGEAEAAKRTVVVPRLRHR